MICNNTLLQSPQPLGTAIFRRYPQSQRVARRQVVRQASAEVDAEAQLRRPSKPQESAASSAPSSSGVTIEYQRKQAKEMQNYFKSQKAAKTIEKSKVFGWTRKNEITNGRWVMFGFAVGLLTEYATGVDFPNQFKLMLSYLGIADVYD